MKAPKHTRAPTRRAKLRAMKVVGIVFLALLGAAAGVLFVPGVFLNPFLEARISQKCKEAFPGNTVRMKGIHFDIWANTIECDSFRMNAPDSTSLITAASVSVKGLSRLPLLVAGDLTADVLADALVEARDVMVNVPQWNHALRVSRLMISAPDSSLAIDSLEYRPPMSDNAFFALREFRRTRYLLAASGVILTGLDVPGMIRGNNYHTRRATFDDAYLSVMIDKEKSNEAGAPAPPMPNDILALIVAPFRIDTLSLKSGRLRYDERFDTASALATIRFDDIRLTAAGFTNQAGGGDTMTIMGRGILMGGAEMTVRMAFPVELSDLSFRYSGRLGPMELSDFNSFVEASEQVRVKTGTLHATTFNVNVTSGMARGDVLLQYEDLKIVAINDRTGSESGVVNTVVSFLANNIKLRTTNMPDESGVMKIGTIQYQKSADDAFLEFAWLSVRSGIRDVVGF